MESGLELVGCILLLKSCHILLFPVGFLTKKIYNREKYITGNNNQMQKNFKKLLDDIILSHCKAIPARIGLKNLVRI